MREAPKKSFSIFFKIRGVRWGGAERGAKYAEGGGRNSVCPPSRCTTAWNDGN